MISTENYITVFKVSTCPVSNTTCQGDGMVGTSVLCLKYALSLPCLQVYHDSEEGQRYCQFYKVEKWPYVAVLDPQTGENLVSWNKVEPLTFCDMGR